MIHQIPKSLSELPVCVHLVVCNRRQRRFKERLFKRAPFCNPSFHMLSRNLGNSFAWSSNRIFLPPLVNPFFSDAFKSLITNERHDITVHIRFLTMFVLTNDTLWREQIRVASDDSETPQPPYEISEFRHAVCREPCPKKPERRQLIKKSKCTVRRRYA